VATDDPALCPRGGTRRVDEDTEVDAHADIPSRWASLHARERKADD
jgi:hypothetical protein